MKCEADAECKMCSRPFTVYQWRPGKGSKFRKTQVCQMCARLKNVCQVCLLDLEYGLSVQSRDYGLGMAGFDSMQMPESEVGREWQQDLIESNAENGNLLEYDKVKPSDVIMNVAKLNPHISLKHEDTVCSFWLKGMCKRGNKCPYKHEIPDEAKHLSKAQPSKALAPKTVKSKIGSVGNGDDDDEDDEIVAADNNENENENEEEKEREKTTPYSFMSSILNLPSATGEMKLKPKSYPSMDPKKI